MKLSRESQKFFDTIKRDYRITDEAGLLLLQIVCESLDLIRDAQAEIKKHGLVVVDRYNQVKQNPASSILRDAKSSLLQALKQLNLDFDLKEAKENILDQLTGRPTSEKKDKKQTNGQEGDTKDV